MVISMPKRISTAVGNSQVIAISLLVVCVARFHRNASSPYRRYHESELMIFMNPRQLARLIRWLS